MKLFMLWAALVDSVKAVLPVMLPGLPPPLWEWEDLSLILWMRCERWAREIRRRIKLIVWQLAVQNMIEGAKRARETETNSSYEKDDDPGIRTPTNSRCNTYRASRRRALCNQNLVEHTLLTLLCLVPYCERICV